MKHSFRKTAAAAMGLLGLAVMSTPALSAECSPENWQACKGKPWVDGDTMATPLGSQWWPNPLWGEDDEAGSTNWYTKPEVIARALSANAGNGKVYKLGHPYTDDMPLFGARKFSLRTPVPTGVLDGLGGNKITWNDEFLATEVGQVGTQFDGLGHIGVTMGAPGEGGKMRWYNGFSAVDITSAYGLKKLGTEKLHPIVARGVLIDVSAIWGGDMKAGDLITMEHVKKALAAQGMSDFEFAAGDAVIIRTGWEKHWGDPPTYNDGCPGIGMEVARWIAEDVQAGVTGFDTWPGDAVPNPDPACVFCVHTYLQTRHGIVNQENMKLSQLAADGVYTFTYVYSPAPIAGATGSMGAPIAIH
ncbi:MAG: cyclase family protein [Gammaproteobacteria bacterium]|nr:cyclase family protein [Gammaproteobacteria bacterium]